MINIIKRKSFLYSVMCMTICIHTVAYTHASINTLFFFISSNQTIYHYAGYDLIWLFPVTYDTFALQMEIECKVSFHLLFFFNRKNIRGAINTDAYEVNTLESNIFIYKCLLYCQWKRKSYSLHQCEKELTISHHINIHFINGLEHVEIIKVNCQVSYTRLLQSARIEYPTKSLPNEHLKNYNLTCSTVLNASSVYSILATRCLSDQLYARQ